MEYVSIILALLKAVPTFDKWFKSLALAYGKWKLESFDKEFSKAFLIMIRDNDQRLIEEVLGMRAGPPQDMDGVISRPRKP